MGEAAPNLAPVTQPTISSDIVTDAQTRFTLGIKNATRSPKTSTTLLGGLMILFVPPLGRTHLCRASRRFAFPRSSGLRWEIL